MTSRKKQYFNSLHVFFREKKEIKEEMARKANQEYAI